MGKLKPLYVKMKSGRIVPIEKFRGIKVDKTPSTGKESIPAFLNPELVITEEEFEKQIRQMVENNYEPYKPIIEALKKYGSLTLEKISEITGRSVNEEERYLERLYKAAFIEKEGNVYSMTDENLKDILSSFGVV